MSRRHEIGVGCLLIVALGLTAGMALQIGALSGFGSTVDVTVPLPDAAGLQAGAVVAVVGVQVGTVERLELAGDRAVAHLALQPDAGLRRDARVRVRARSLLGEKYLELTPVSADAPLLQDGDALAAAGPQVEIDELVEALGPLVGALDPEVVRAVAGALADALREDPERLARMLDDAERLLSNAAEASDELPALIAETRSTLTQARAAVGVLDARAREAGPVLARADRALERIEAASQPLPEAVAEAREAIAQARGVLGKLDGAADDLGETVEGLDWLDREGVVEVLRDEGIRVRFGRRRPEK